MDDHRLPEPFHAGELRAQRLAGGGPAGAPIRSRMPEQHRQFFPLLRFLCVALADEDGWPVATLLSGEPGFVRSPDPGRLQIAAAPDRDDPAYPYLKDGAGIGMLGIDLATRRRNRANGSIAQVGGEDFLVDVEQSFGNCPKYIRVRQLAPVERPHGRGERFDAALPEDALAMLARCETMFVATSGGEAGGLDISHRGGEAGFLRVRGSVLTVPDYPGNRYFNTLGNLLLEPRAALVIPDFETGDILQLQGRARLVWRREGLDDPRAERAWEFNVVRGWLRRAALALVQSG